MIRRPKRNSGANKKVLENKESLIRQNSATVYGLYFASSNTDFLLDEKKTRFSLRPSVVVKQDRQTLIFDYSTVKGDEASIFDGFFRGLSAGGTGSGASAGSTLALDGGIESTCNFINDVTGIPLTNFADTYTISSIDVSKKIIVAIKANPITSTTAVMFESNKFIDLPQWTKTQTNKDSTLVNKIINLIPSQSMTHLGVFSGSILEFDRTSKNNGRFTVENVYNQNGFEVIDVKETVVYEDASGDQVIVSVYGEEKPTETKQPIESSSNRFPSSEWSSAKTAYPGCTAPVYSDIPLTGTARGQWIESDLNCCKCLVYAEGECNNDQCQICTAWVAYNRRKDSLKKNSPIPQTDGRREDSYCDQTRMKSKWAGGWGNDKFDDCWCDITYENATNAEIICIEKAESICDLIGHDNPNNLVDPTGGANHFWTRGQAPGWMDCNLQGSDPNCKKVTGVCANCGNDLYICKRMPKPCEELGVRPRPKKQSGIDDTPVEGV